MADKKKISQELGLNDQTPREIVEELDKYIVGQDEAKKSVAIALRNRWRSHKLPDEMRDDVIPKNILMIGSTGVGKTEIARRLAKLVRAPFIKVEATKFTEVGYVGRDVESIIRDLVQTAVRMVRKQRTEEVKEKAAANAIERLLDVLVPEPKRSQNPLGKLFGNADTEQTTVEVDDAKKPGREFVRKRLLAGNIRSQDGSNQENHAVVMYELDVFSNKATGRKAEAKAIAKVVDQVMLTLGFNRTFLNTIPNEYDATIYRVKGRYTAVVGSDETIYRR